MPGALIEDGDPRFGRLARELGALCVGVQQGRARLDFHARVREQVAELASRCDSARVAEHLEIDLLELTEFATRSPVGACLLAACESWKAPTPSVELMGVVNVTPDSFSDGGRYLDPRLAIEHGLRLAAEGATWLDVGGESTRPGADPVGQDEELRRVLAVVGALATADVARVSIDTRKAGVAQAALDAGACMVNDVGAGLDDPAMLALVADREVNYCLMHRQGSIREMQANPRYADPLAEVAAFLRERVAACLAAGIARERLYIDPGIGFGKALAHNLELLRRLGEMRSLGLPLLLGVSRKSFIGQIHNASQSLSTAASTPEQRVGGTAAAISFCVRGGARVLRVHDVAIMAEASAVAQALETPI